MEDITNQLNNSSSPTSTLVENKTVSGSLKSGGVSSAPPMDKCIMRAGCLCSMCSQFSSLGAADLQTATTTKTGIYDEEDGTSQNESKSLAAPVSPSNDVNTSIPLTAENSNATKQTGVVVSKSTKQNQKPKTNDIVENNILITSSSAGNIDSENTEVPSTIDSDSITNKEIPMNSDAIVEKKPTTLNIETEEEIVAVPSKGYDIDVALAEAGDPLDTQPPKPVSSLGTLEERLVDKSWATRRVAYEEMKACLSTKNEQSLGLLDHTKDLLIKMISDSNMKAQSTALEAVATWFNIVDLNQIENMVTSNTLSEIISKIVDKSFHQRAPTPVNAIGILLEMLRRCNDLSGESSKDAIQLIVKETIKGLKSRKKKTPPVCIQALKSYCSELGLAKLPFKDILDALLKSLTSDGRELKDKALELACELYLWMRSPLRGFIKGLKPSQEKLIDESFSELDKTNPQMPTPLYPKVDPNTIPSSNGSSNGNMRNTSSISGGSCTNVITIDPWDIATEVDLMAIFHKFKFTDKITAPKWSDRVDALKHLITSCGSPSKLKQSGSEFQELISILTGLMARDNNMQVQSYAIRVITALASGLRQAFSSEAKRLCSTVLAMYKHKKGAIVTAVNECLDTLLQHCTTLDEIIESVNTSLTSLPQVQISTIKWLNRCIDSLGSKCWVGNGSIMVDITRSLVKQFSAGSPDIRNAAVDCVIAILKNKEVGSNTKILSLIKPVQSANARIYKKLAVHIQTESSTEESESKVAAVSATSKPSSVNQSKTNSKKRSAVTVNKTKTVKKTSPKNTDKPTNNVLSVTAGHQVSASPITTTTTTESKSASSVSRERKSGVTVAEESANDLSPEEADEKLKSIGIPQWVDHLSGVAGGKWQDKKQAFDALAAFIATQGEAFRPYAEAAIVWTATHSSKFKVSNFNLASGAFNVATAVFKAAATPKRVAIPVVNQSLTKIGDKKLKSFVNELLLAASECIGPKLIILHSITSTKKTKAPLILKSVIEFQITILKEFGAKSTPVKDLITFAKSDKAIGCANAGVRTASIDLFGELYHQLGDLVDEMACDGLKPSLVSSLKTQFEKVGYNPQSVSVSRVVRGEESSDASDTSAADELKSLRPCVDIVPQLTVQLFKDMESSAGKDAWKKRSAALDQVSDIIAKAKGVEFNKGLAKLIRGLKKRLSDSNGNLKIKALRVLAALSNALGPKISVFNKFILADILLCFSENKKSIIASTLLTMNAWVKHDNELDVNVFASVLNYLPVQLKTKNGRGELVEWILQYVGDCTSSLDCLVEPCILCVQDRVATTRSASEKLLGYVIKSVGMEPLELVIRDMKPAAARAIKPFIGNAMKLAQIESTSSVTDKNPSKEKSGISVSSSAIGKNTNNEIEKVSSKTVVKGSKRDNNNNNNNNNKSSNSSNHNMGKTSKKQSSSVNVEATSTKDNKLSLMHKSSIKDKEVRKKKNARSRWVFEEPREDFQIQLKSEMEPMFSKVFLESLFGKGAKCIKKSYDGILECILDSPDECVSNVDLILKWLTIQMVSRESAVTTKYQSDAIQVLFDMLVDKSYTLDDYEATIFLPFAIEKLGHSKVRFRNVFQKIIRTICQVYPASKLSPHLLDGLQSKNTRTRAGCMEELTRIVKEGGWRTVTLKGMLLVLKQVDHNDKQVRNAAVGCLEVMWKEMGEDTPRFYEYMKKGNLTNKIQGIIDEHFKYHSSGSNGNNNNSNNNNNTSQPPSSVSAVAAKTHSSTANVTLPSSSSIPPPASVAPASYQVKHDRDIKLETVATTHSSKSIDLVEANEDFGDLFSAPELIVSKSSMNKAPSTVNTQYYDEPTTTTSSSSGSYKLSTTPTATTKSIFTFSKHVSPLKPVDTCGGDIPTLPAPVSTASATDDNDLFAPPPVINNLSINAASTTGSKDTDSLFATMVIEAIRESTEYFEGLIAPFDAEVDHDAYVKGLQTIKKLSLERHRESISKAMNEIVVELLKLLRSTFGTYMANGPSTYAARYRFEASYVSKVMTAIVRVIHHQYHKVATKSMKELLEFLCLGITDQRLQNISGTSTEVHQQNKGLMSCFSNTAIDAARHGDRTDIICILIDLMTNGKNDLSSYSDFYPGVLVKILSKVLREEAKKVDGPATSDGARRGYPFDTVDCPKILISLNRYFSCNSSSNSLRNSAKDLLKRLVQSRGALITLDVQKSGCSSASEVYSMICEISPHLHLSVETPVENSVVSDLEEASSSSAYLLSSIFDEILRNSGSLSSFDTSSGSATSSGIQKLKDFTLRNPSVNVEERLRSYCSPQFTDYIMGKLNCIPLTGEMKKLPIHSSTGTVGGATSTVSNGLSTSSVSSIINSISTSQTSAMSNMMSSNSATSNSTTTTNETSSLSKLQARLQGLRSKMNVSSSGILSEPGASPTIDTTLSSTNEPQSVDAASSGTVAPTASASMESIRARLGLMKNHSP